VRIASKPIQDYPFYLRPFFHLQRRKYGMVLEPALMWARVPRLFFGVLFLFGTLDRRSSPLTPALRFRSR
jgi:hypothetical protein